MYVSWIMFAQTSAFFDNVFSKYQYKFRKTCHHYHLKMSEIWKKCVGKGSVFCALLTDLSKAFHYLNNELLTAKLKAYNITPYKC